MLLLVNQEDLTKETEQQNLPGSTAQYPNWRKIKLQLEELRTAGAGYTAMLLHQLERMAAYEKGLVEEALEYRNPLRAYCRTKKS